MKPKNDVPIEGVLKWLKKDRDDLLEKLNKIIPYTKSLEEKVKSLEQQKLNLQKQVSERQKEIAHTPEYKQLNKRYADSQKANKDLLVKIGHLYRKLDK